MLTIHALSKSHLPWNMASGVTQGWIVNNVAVWSQPQTSQRWVGKCWYERTKRLERCQPNLPYASILKIRHDNDYWLQIRDSKLAASQEFTRSTQPSALCGMVKWVLAVVKGRNGKFCTTVGPVARTASIPIQSVNPADLGCMLA